MGWSGGGLARLVLTQLQNWGGGGGGREEGGGVHVCEVLLGVDSPADVGAFVCVHACEGTLGVTWPADMGCMSVFMHIHMCMCLSGGGGGGGGAVAFFHCRWHCIDYPTL